MRVRTRAGRVLGWVAGAIRRSRRLTAFSNRYSRKGLPEFVDEWVAELSGGPGKKRVLSVGAGGDLGERVARLANCELVTLDCDPARRPDVVADVRDLSRFADDSFDAVFLLEVLEHVQDPARAIVELHRVLRDGGILVLSAPFLFETHEAPRDFYRFTRFGLAYLLQDFRSVDIRPRGGYASSALVPMLRLTRSPYPLDVCLGLVCAGLALVCHPLIAALDRLIRWDAATTGFVAVCQK